MYLTLGLNARMFYQVFAAGCIPTLAPPKRLGQDVDALTLKLMQPSASSTIQLRWIGALSVTCAQGRT